MKLPTSFFLGLIGALSLSACAQPVPTAPVKPADQTTTIVQPEPMVSEPVASKNESSKKDIQPMIDLDNPPRGPAIPVAELKTQILALIASLTSREDMTREHVEKMMGIKLKPHPRADDMFIYFGQVTQGWSYNIVSTYTYGDPIPSIEIGFINEEKVLDDALPKTCMLESEVLSRGIEALGFERSDELFRMNGRKWWGFRKNMPEHNAIFGIEVHVYQADNGTEDGLLCVKQIGIGTDPIHE